MQSLPTNFPFKTNFEEFLTEYGSCPTYWYVPKARTLNDQNITVAQSIMTVIFDEFLGRVWNPESQDELLRRLAEKQILEPYSREGTLRDRTALTRIWKKLLETLGLLFVQDDKEMVVTDAGLELMIANNPRPIIESQIAKVQYPTPSLRGDYRDDFKGILPHLFLLQVLRECSYRIVTTEYELFVNLAQGQEDLERIVNLINCWRDLNKGEQETIMNVVEGIPMYGDPNYTRHRRIRLNRSYQLSFYTYPSYLSLEPDNHDTHIVCNAPNQVDNLVERHLRGLKITRFGSLEDWFAYFGDPKQQPSWFTYLSMEIEKASTREDTERVVEQHKEHLTQDEAKEIERKQIEKGIETFYIDHLVLLEKGLTLVEGGRQYSTPIGRIDLFCRSERGEYVIVEIKADEVSDSAFGQILRYIGWTHRNLPDAKYNVRGIILAGKFPETARYSRIGLLREDHQYFLKFKRHGLYVSDT